MSIKKIATGIAGILFIAMVGSAAYVYLTIDNKPVVVEDQNSPQEEAIYIVPNTFANYSLNSEERAAFKTKPDQSISMLEKEADLDLDQIENIAVQMTFAQNEKEAPSKNTVYTFKENKSTGAIVDKLDANSTYEKIETEKGEVFYQSNEKPDSYIYFPDEQTMVVTPDSKLATDQNQPKENVQNKLSNKGGVSFSFQKGSPSIEHFTNSLPDYMTNKFEGISGRLSEQEGSSSYIEVKMKSSFYARSLEMAMPQIMNQVKSKIQKVDGKFIIDGNSVVMSPEDLKHIDDIIGSINFESSGSSIYFLMEDNEKLKDYMDLITNVIINQ